MPYRFTRENGDFGDKTGVILDTEGIMSAVAVPVSPSLKPGDRASVGFMKDADTVILHMREINRAAIVCYTVDAWHGRRVYCRRG